MSEPTPQAAEGLRKLAAGALAVGLTLLMLRVFERLAHGRLAWGDPALWGLLFLGLLTAFWARYTVRVRPQRPAAPPAPRTPVTEDPPP